MIGCRGLLFFVPAVLLTILTPLLCSSSVYLISFLQFPCASVWENTRALVPISYSHTEWYLLFSLLSTKLRLSKSNHTTTTISLSIIFVIFICLLMLFYSISFICSILYVIARMLVCFDAKTCIAKSHDWEAPWNDADWPPSRAIVVN